MNPSIYVKKLLDTNNRAHTPSHSDSASLHPHVGLAPNKSKIKNSWKCINALQLFLFYPYSACNLTKVSL